MTLSDRAKQFLTETPENELSEFLWNWMKKMDECCNSMIDEMLYMGMTPEWINSHSPMDKLPIEMQKAMLNTVRWRSRNLLSDA
jgi:hypothetical protein